MDCAENPPDHRTINEFSGKRMPPVIEEQFQVLVEYLADGTKIESDETNTKRWAKLKEQYKKEVNEVLR